MDYRYAAVPSFAGGHADSDDTILEGMSACLSLVCVNEVCHDIDNELAEVHA